MGKKSKREGTVKEEKREKSRSTNGMKEEREENRT